MFRKTIYIKVWIEVTVFYTTERRIRAAQSLLSIAKRISESDPETLERFGVLGGAELLLEAFTPKYDPKVKPHQGQDISKIVEKPLPKKTTRDVGVTDQTFMQDVEEGTANILAVYDQAKKDLTTEEFDFWTKWYTHAHEDIQNLSKKYDVPFNLVAAMVAVLSPSTKWLPNLLVVERVLRLSSSFLEYGGRKEFEARILKLGNLVTTLLDLEKKWEGKIHKERIPLGMRGRVYEQLGKIRKVLKKKREAYKAAGKEYKELIKKHLGEISGSQEKVGHFIDSYPRNVRKAINLLESEDTKKYLIGPKVNAFYQALLEPDVEYEMVIDGHAVQLWLGVKNPIKSAPKPLGNRRKKILQSYKAAAEARGTTTRAVQAVTWYFWKFIINEQVTDEPQEEMPF